MKFDTGDLYEKLSIYFNFHLDFTRLQMVLHEVLQELTRVSR
jgi:hypothetical protein